MRRHRMDIRHAFNIFIPFATVVFSFLVCHGAIITSFVFRFLDIYFGYDPSSYRHTLPARMLSIRFVFFFNQLLALLPEGLESVLFLYNRKNIRNIKDGIIWFL